MISRLIQLISLAFIVFVILINLKILIFGDNLYKFSFIIPLSINKITYLEDILEEDQNNIFFLGNINITRFYFADSNEICDFLMNLDSNKHI